MSALLLRRLQEIWCSPNIPLLLQIYGDRWSVFLFLLKSMIICFVLMDHVVVFAPFGQAFHLVPVGPLHHYLKSLEILIVVSSANLIMVLEGWMEVQSGVKRRKGIGLNTQPCGVSVFRTRLEEVFFPILTHCGLLVRKSMSHKQRDVPRPRLHSLLISLWGITMSKMKLNSTNTILT